MTNQNEKILFNLIQSVDKTLEEDEGYQQLLRSKSKSVSHMFLYLGQDVGLKMDEIKNLTAATTKKIIESAEFAKWMDPSYKLAWLKIRAIDLLALKKNDFFVIMPYEMEGEFKGEIKEYLLKIGKGTKIAVLQSEEDIDEVSQEIENSPQWIKILKRFPLVNLDELQSVEFADKQQEQSRIERLNELKNSLKKCVSSILDEHFEENLIKSFESQIKKSKSFTSNDYNQFKDKLLQIASEFKIDNYEMKRQLNSALGQNQDYYNKILNVRSKIHPIYIPELMYLLEKNKAAKNIVGGKDIIVILGISGAGKSTLVQMMLEYQLVVKKSDKQMTTLVPKGGLKPEHKQFVAKASSKSITKYVSAIQLNLPAKHQNLGQIYLADTPGFFDSEGLMVDANNSLSTIRTLGSANSVRFILLVNQRNWGTRGQGFKKLAKVISKLFKVYSASKIIYFLNCFTDDQLQELPKNMRDIQKNLNAEQKGDNKFFTVVNHFCSLMEDAQEKGKEKKIPIRQAIRQYISQLVVMEPEKIATRQIYQKILNEDRKIMNPAGILDNVVSPEVKQALQNEVSNLDLIISSCIKKDKIDSALYYINNLSQIAKQTKQIGDIGQAQQKLDNLKANLQENFNKQYRKLEKTMQGQVLALRISEEAINETKYDFDKLIELEKTYRKITLFENFNKSEDISRIVQQTSQILQNKMKQQLSEDLIKTIYLFSDRFNPKIKETFINSMKAKIKMATQQIKSVIDTETYGNLEQKINNYEQLKNLVSKNENFAQIQSNWKNDLQKKIDNRVTITSDIFLKYGGQFRQIRDLDVKQLKDTLDIFSRTNQYSQNPQLKKIAEQRKQIKKECLALCRKFILEIKKIIRHNTESIRHETIQDVTRCKANILKIMKQISQIQDQLQSEFSYELNSIVGLISSKIQTIDTEMNKIQKESFQDWGAVKNIHNSIKMLKKLSYVCQEAQRKQCMKTISQSQQNLTNKLNDFLTEMDGTVFSIETPHATVSRLMNAYKISILQKDSKRSVSRKNQQEEQIRELGKNIQELQDEDKVINACTKVKDLIRQKIGRILEEISKFVDQKITKQHLQCFDGQISTAIKIKKIYDEVKFTNFQPQTLNNQITSIKQKYFKALREIFRQICDQISSFIAKYQHAINGEMNQISREQIYRIIKLKKILDKLQKNSQLNSILENFGIIAADENEKIKDGLQHLQQRILTKFSQNLKDSSTIKICFELINAFETLKYFDNTFGSQFQKLFVQFKQKLNTNLKEQGYDINPNQFIKPGNIDLFTFKKVYDFLKSYGANTSQGNKYKLMMERLKTQIRQQDRTLQPIFNKLYGVNTNIDDAEIEKIYLTIKKHLEIAAQINQIVNEQQNIKINQQTLNKISNVGRRIIENCERRIKNKIEEGGNSYNEAQDLIQKIRYLQSILLGFKIKQFQDYISERQSKLGKGIAEYYCQFFDKKKQQRQGKYIKCQNIALDSSFAAEFQTFTDKQKQLIEVKVEKKITKQIQEIKQRCKSKSTRSLQTEFKQTFEIIKYLPGEMKNKFKQSIEQAKKISIEQRNTESAQAKQKFNFKNCFDLMLVEVRPQITRVYEEMTEKYFDDKKSELVKNSGQFVETKNNLYSTFIENFKSKNLEAGSNSNFKNIYDKYSEQAIKIVKTNHIDKSLRKIKDEFNTNFIEKNKQASIQIIKNHFEEDVQMIKFLITNKKYFPKYDQMSDIEAIQKQVDAFYAELAKKTDELSYEAIKNSPKALNLWYFESMCFLTATQTLHVIEVPQILAIYDKLKPEIVKIKEKKGSLCSEITNRVTKVEKIIIYSESMKNISDKQRQKYFQEIDQDLSLMASFAKSEVKLTQHNFQDLVRKSSHKIKKDMEEGIDRSCKDIQAGFGSLSVEFSKQINLTLKLTEVAKVLTFATPDKSTRDKLGNKIQSCYKIYFDKMRDQCQRIEPLKKQNQQKAGNIINQSNQKITRIKNEKTIQLNQKIQKLNQNLKQDIQNQKDQAEQEKLKKKCENQIEQLNRDFQISMAEIEKQFHGQQQKVEVSYGKKISGAVQGYADCVTILYKATLQISYKQQQMKETLERRLLADSKTFGKKIFNQVHENLKAKGNTYATILINNHDAFKSNQAVQWKAKVKGNDVEYVLSQLNISGIMKNQLKDMFDAYTSKLNSWTSKYQHNPSIVTINSLLEQVRTESANLKNYYHNNGNASLANPPFLLALIFALWIILNSQIEEDIVQFSYQPHPAQVIAIFLCLSFLRHDNPKALNSKMAQIGTGEGKSVVLAGLSSYLALCDFQVNSVCYSVYLSSRDRQAFTNLFDKLQINSKISYGTFDNVCESLLNKQTGESKGFRNQIKLMLEQEKPGWFGKIMSKLTNLFKTLIPSTNDSNKGKKIMLIDEVDVFFDPSFFGSLYCPDVCLASPQISELMKFVWKYYKERPEITDAPITNSNEFKNVNKKYSKLQKLFRQQVKGMILGCRGCDHDYVIRDDLIQYKDQDGISSKINYGFQTLFAYLKEHDRNKITGSSLERALKVSLIIAEFSYALLPKYFRSIIGVTGTYEDMSSFKKRYMQTEYQVKAAYAIPSVYGNTKRRVINKPKIVPPDQHYAEVIKQIKEVHASERPVLVFFKSATELQNFFNLAEYQDLQAQTTFLNETHGASERDLRIKMTCNRSKITLMTNSFGRGTDFKIFDETLFKIGDGGLHVIQTFLSVDLSQQIQIQGRTARQGNPGTYTLIIPIQEMELLDMKPEAASNFLCELKKARQARENKQWSEIVARLNQSNSKHQKCVAVYQNEKVEEKQILEYIKQLNGYPQIRKTVCRTFIVCDATGSMSSVLQKLLSILGEVVKDIIDITSNFNSSSTSQVMLGVYRNYNCSAEMLFQSTPFQSQAQNLLTFLKSVYAAGGICNEAAETAYYHINTLSDVDQVIIIGDAPSNTAAQTISGRRGYKGEKYWIDHNVPLLSAETQLNQIISKGIPVHSFYINTYPQLGTAGYFIDVSRRTKGHSEEFNVNASDSSKKLSQFVVQRILLKSACDSSQAGQMVSMYRKRHSL